MAFFGLTHLGYQNPIGDKLIVNPKVASHFLGICGCDGVCPSCLWTRVTPWTGHGLISITAGLSPLLQEQHTPLRCANICSVYLQPLPYSIDIHQGSYEQYKEMVKRVQTPRSPNQIYAMPLTDSQQYGWMMSQRPEPWTHVKRFPRKNSEMTKFVKEMSMTDREFSLF